ncbi:MAG: UDP-N-acetylglucosamine 2-epimerase (non-hydrolyzing) [Eubacteriales bacterium]
MKKIMAVLGTRPEAIKMCPVIIELKKRKNVDLYVCITGQHREMLRSVLDIFGVRADCDLDIMKEGQSLADITKAVLDGISEVLEREKPDVVLVHGDTTTAFAASLACFYKKIPVGHVEAGLRTYDVYSPYPEEFNRRAIDITARYLFAPTRLSAENLLREGADENSIFVTGNTAIDALRLTVKEEYSSPITEAAAGKRIILLTAHRRESHGEALRGIFRAVRRIADEFDDVMIVYPVHPNPVVRAAAEEILSGRERIMLTEPLDVIAFHNLMAKSFFIMTDSGGIQEEAPSLGKPVLVLRDVTERPEGVEAGTLRIAGTDEEKVYLDCKNLLCNETEYAKMSSAENPYGDGKASRRIADALLSEA